MELNYNHLRYFWAVALDGNLTRTAARLNVSQSALSVQIRKLEDRLGHPLFERRGRQLHLTEAGRIAFDHAQSIFAAGDELVGTLKTTGRTRQAVRVGALATLSRNFQLDFLRPLVGRDDVDIVLRSAGSGELMRALEALQLDIVLSNQPPAADALTPFIAHKLAEQTVSLIGPAHLGAAKPGLSQLLADNPLILPSSGNGVRIGFDALANTLGIRPQIVAEVDDMAMMRLLAREGAGIAVLPSIVVKDELADGRLVELARLPDISESFYAITIERRFPNPVVAQLISTHTPRNISSTAQKTGVRASLRARGDDGMG
ncbi:LysR family transcriptional regulator [Sphingomonas sp. GlSt437]|uniref:LysR family transcriptional regulator n=1 Tax=Sphingomonas sp. GlSt437 TaxID=3389970 RepID=UPI003EBDF91F